MNQTPPLPPDAETRMKRAREIRGLLLLAKAQGYTVAPDPDRRGVFVRWHVGLSGARLSSAVREILQREGEVYDHLESLARMAVAALEDDDLADAGVAPARSPGEASTEGAPGPRVGPHGSIPPSADRTPSIPPSLVVDGVGREPVMYHPCPACDPGRPCLDHGGVEQAPPPMPGWMRATCWALVAGLLGWVAALLLVGGGGQ